MFTDITRFSCFRIIAERKICNWHLAYYRILSSIQNEMVNIHGYYLFANKDFTCDNCCDTNNISNI